MHTTLRHPNYFGEILMWSAMVLTCSAAFTHPIHWLGLLSPAFTAFLLLGVSGVPMLVLPGCQDPHTYPPCTPSLMTQ